MENKILFPIIGISLLLFFVIVYLNYKKVIKFILENTIWTSTKDFKNFIGAEMIMYIGDRMSSSPIHQTYESVIVLGDESREGNCRISLPLFNDEILEGDIKFEHCKKMKEFNRPLKYYLNIKSGKFMIHDNKSILASLEKKYKYQI